VKKSRAYDCFGDFLSYAAAFGFFILHLGNLQESGITKSLCR
jgi:hypothetical protein